MKQAIFKKLFIVLTLVAAAVPNIAVYAQQNQPEKDGIGISPTKLTLDADPGETIKGSFLVTNPGTNEAEYSLSISDFVVTNEEYEKDFSPVEGAKSPVGWMTVAEGVQTLEPGAREEQEYTISVPEDAVPRGYYAVIFAETTAKDAETTGVTRIKRVGTLVYLTVNGGSVEKGEVISFGADSLQEDKPVKADVRVRNDGNVHFTARGTMWLKDMFGREVSRTSISGTVLPATIRKFNAELELSQPFGLYRLGGDVKFLDKTTELESKWVIVGSPFWIVLWAVIIVGWAVVLIRWIKKRVKRKHSEK